MTHKQLAILASILFLGVLATSLGRKFFASEENASSQDEWTSFDGGDIRLEHPKEWKAQSIPNPPKNRRDWTVDPPNAKEDYTGTIFINELTAKLKNISFEEIISNEKKWPGVRLVNPPKQLKLKIGRCISYPREMQAGGGYLATLHTHCFRENGNYVDIWADIGRYKDNTKPDAVSLRNALIYERVLNSIEFL